MPDIMPDGPRDARIRTLQDVLAEIAHQAQAAKMALCDKELQIRLETILRLAEAARTPDGDVSGSNAEPSLSRGRGRSPGG